MYLRASEAQIVPLTVASCLADKEIRLWRLKGKTREKEAKAGNKYLPHLRLEGLVTGWVIVWFFGSRIRGSDDLSTKTILSILLFPLSKPSSRSYPKSRSRFPFIAQQRRWEQRRKERGREGGGSNGFCGQHVSTMLSHPVSIRGKVCAGVQHLPKGKI